MSGKTANDYEGDYTDPELRARLKEEIKAGDRGGRPGQWSARKSQLLVAEYEKHGGGYRHEGDRTESQRHLEQWTEQDWRAADGDAEARGDDGSTRRYLPDAAWQLLSAEERRATDRKKKSGQEQHVANTEAAREARAAAELIDLPAPEARRRVGDLHGESQLDRAERAERELGKGRKTVLDRIAEQRAAEQSPSDG